MRDEIPAALAPLAKDALGTAPAAALPDADAGAPPAGQLTKEQRDALAQAGRERAELQRRAQAAEAEARAARQESQQVRQRLDAQEEARNRAYLDSLDPAERDQAVRDAELVRLRREVDQLTQRAQSPTRTPEQTREEIKQRAQRVLDRVNTDHGTQLRLDDERLSQSWESIQVFNAAARALAANDQRTPPAPQTSADAAAAPPPVLTAGRSLSPRPVAGGARITDQDLEDITWTRNSRKPGEFKQRLAEAQQAALRQARMPG